MIIIRPYSPTDWLPLYRMLAREGIPDKEAVFSRFPTFVMDRQGPIGFFTLDMQHEAFPHLRHFVVHRDHRGPTTARLLTKAVRHVVKSLGYSKMIIHAKQEYLGILIRHIFRVDPYAEEGGVKFYLVEV